MNNMVPSLSSYFSVCEKHTMIFQSNCPKQQYFLLIPLVIHVHMYLYLLNKYCKQVFIQNKQKSSNNYIYKKSTLERYIILVGFYANACQGRRQCCCWTSYIKNGRVIPMRPLLVVGLLPLPLPCLPACFPMMYISPESASSTWQYWPVVAAFSHLVSYSPLPKQREINR